jgi:hypothetical protein
MKDYTTTNIDLENLANKMKLNLVGVYSKDTLPSKCYVGSYIINMESANDGDGSHWTSLYITPKKEVLYFDSFGLAPPIEIKEFVSNKPVAINTRQIQDKNSTMCGYFCLWFIHYIQQHHKQKNIFEVYDNFLNIFRYDTLRNDEMVKTFFSL